MIKLKTLNLEREIWNNILNRKQQNNNKLCQVWAQAVVHVPH